MDVNLRGGRHGGGGFEAHHGAGWKHRVSNERDVIHEADDDEHESEPGCEAVKSRRRRWTAETAVDVERVKQRKSFMDFVRAVLFLTVFLVMMSLHQSIGAVFELERTVKFELTEKTFGEQVLTFYDVSDTLMFWEWFHLGLLPVLVRQTTELGDLFPTEEWGYFGEYSRIVGGVRLIQQRSKHEKCPSRLMSEFYGVECFPSETASAHAFGLPKCDESSASENATHSTQCFRSSSYSAVDFYHDEGFSIYGSENAKDFEFWLDVLEPEQRIFERVHYLEERRWLDRKTKSIAVQLLLYNGQVDPLLCSVTLHFQFLRTGFVVATAVTDSVPCFPYQNNIYFKVALEVVYACIIVSIAYEERRQLAKTMKRAGSFAGVKAHFFSGVGAVGNCISACNVVCGVVLVGVWIPFCLQLKAVTFDLAHLHRPEGLATYVDDDGDAWSVFHHEIAQIEREVGVAIDEMRVIRNIGGINVFFVLVRLLKVWTNIPALRVVAITLANALKRLATFAIIVISLVGIFAGAGYLLFGHILDEFHSFGEACVTTLVTVFSADPGVYAKMRRVDEVAAAIWNLLVFSLFGMTVVNMVLAIIVDAYEDARSLQTVHDVSLNATAIDTVTHFFADNQQRWSAARRRVKSAKRRASMPIFVAKLRASRSRPPQVQPQLKVRPHCSLDP